MSRRCHEGVSRAKLVLVLEASKDELENGVSSHKVLTIVVVLACSLTPDGVSRP